jgi:ribosomal subunit interface protein
MTLLHIEPAISVIGDGLDLGPALESRVRRSIERMTRKFFGHLIAANAYFVRDGQLFSATVNLQIGRLGFVTSEASDQNFYRALQAALDKAEKQLRRMKRRLRDGKSVPLRHRVSTRADESRRRHRQAVSHDLLAGAG